MFPHNSAKQLSLTNFFVHCQIKRNVTKLIRRNETNATSIFNFYSRCGAQGAHHCLEARKTRQEAPTKFESKCKELKTKLFFFIFVVEFSVRFFLFLHKKRNHIHEHNKRMKIH